MMDINQQADNLCQRIKHFLITSIGKVIDQASTQEFYTAFSKALREEIMINWASTTNSFRNKKVRTVNYLSMEYLPGRLLGNNITNIGAKDVVQAVLTKMNRNWHELASCESDPGLGNGGLGRLASCFLDSLSAQHYPAFGYGLRYQYGIFEQEIWNGVQVERPDCWLLSSNPWEFRRDTLAVNIHLRGRPLPATNTHGDEVYHLEDYEEVRALPYDSPVIGYPSKEGEFSVITLRLWSTKESPRNFELQRYNAGRLDQAGENTSLTDVLYPNDNHETGKRIRLKQEFLLVSASLQDIIHRHIQTFGDLSQLGDKVRIQINDTHPALVIAELMRILTKDHDVSWKDAWITTQMCCSYTNHTIMREALEEWNEERLQYLLPRQYTVIQKLNQEFCEQIRKKFGSDEERVRRMSIIEEGQVKMAHLAIFGSHKVNGVAELHTKILKERIFKDFDEMYPDRIINVTNGVTQRRWLLHCNPLLAKLISERIGEEWVTDFRQIKKLAEFASDQKTQEEFLQMKKENKKALYEFLTQENPIRDDKGKVTHHSQVLDEETLIDVQIKRIHEYKRPLLNALHLIMLYHELKENPEARKVKRLSIVGGKAAPGYETAKEIIQLINAISRKIDADEEIQKHLRVTFVENYNVSKAEVLIPAADLSQQISTAGMEASGTGNMKLAMNGALTLGTEDGANIEMRQEITDQWWPFTFGSTTEEIAQVKATYNAWDIYIKDPLIRKTVDALKDGTFSINEAEQQAFSHLHQSLLEGHFDEPADRYFVLKDIRNYYDVQKKVEDLYVDRHRWAEFALHNIAGMGKFSTDESIRVYAEQIWGLEKCPPDLDILKEVRAEFSEHSPYRIVMSQ